MRGAAISTESLWRRIDTPNVTAHFLTGVILGVLIGLAIAPFLRSWILWRQARELDERYRARPLLDHDEPVTRRP